MCRAQWESASEDISGSHPTWTRRGQSTFLWASSIHQFRLHYTYSMSIVYLVCIRNWMQSSLSSFYASLKGKNFLPATKPSQSHRHQDLCHYSQGFVPNVLSFPLLKKLSKTVNVVLFVSWGVKSKEESSNRDLWSTSSAFSLERIRGGVRHV